MTTNENLNLMFTINNDTGRRMAMSPGVNVATDSFEQGSTVSSSIALPESLATGTYSVHFHYYGTSPRMSTEIPCESNYLNVVGHLAKYGAPFTIDDVTSTIDNMLSGSYPTLTINDVTELIDALLTAE